MKLCPLFVYSFLPYNEIPQMSNKSPNSSGAKRKLGKGGGGVGGEINSPANVREVNASCSVMATRLHRPKGHRVVIIFVSSLERIPIFEVKRDSHKSILYFLLLLLPHYRPFTALGVFFQMISLHYIIRYCNHSRKSVCVPVYSIFKQF